MFYFCKNVFLLTKKKKKKSLALHENSAQNSRVSFWLVCLFLCRKYQRPWGTHDIRDFPTILWLLADGQQKHRRGVFKTSTLFIYWYCNSTVNVPTKDRSNHEVTHPSNILKNTDSFNTEKKKKNLFGLCMTKPYKLLLFCINIFLIFIFFLSSFFLIKNKTLK